MKWGVLLAISLLLLSCTPAKPDIVQENVSQLNNLGVYYAAQGNGMKAKDYFERVIEIEPNHEVARKNLALIYYVEKDFNKSIDHFKVLTEVNDNNPQYHYDLAINIADNCRLNNVCDLDWAIAEFAKANEIEPGYAEAESNIDALKLVMSEMESENQE